MAEKDVTAVEEKDYEHHLTWRGWLSFIVVALSFSGVLKDMGPLSAFDFTVLTGKFGKIAEGATFIGKGGIGASEGFMFSLTLFPTVILALGIVRVVESRGGLLAAERIIRPLLRPLMGLPGYVGLAFISSFTTTDVGAVITRDLYDEGKLTDDERTIFVAYQYAASGTLANTINCGAPLMPISLLSFGIIFMVEIIVKIIGRGCKLMAAQAKNKTILEEFMVGCKKGFYVGVENIMPAMVLAYALILFLNITGLMDIIASAVAPVMALFGLPGAAIVALISAFFAKAAGAATAASLYADGIINAAQATILFPATITMGTLVGHFARCVLTAGTNPKHHAFLLVIPIIDALLSMVIVRVILNFMGISC